MKHLALALMVFLAACARPDPEPVVVTEFIKPNVQIQAQPRAVELRDVNFYVVTEENYGQFVENFTRENGRLVFVALSVEDYESLSLNLADLRRYLNQQKQIIIYYERAVSG